MMGRSHLAVNGAIAAVGLTWLNALRDPASAPATSSDTWIREMAEWPTRILGQGAPAGVGDHPVSGVAQWLWAWLFPFSSSPSWVDGDAGRLGLVAYLVVAAVLLALGTVLPDADSKASLLSRRLPFAVPGPHRGLLHTDWALIALFAASLWPPTRLLVWLWLGAWLHCELDGLSASGRVRFYPLTRYRLVALSGGEVCVGRMGRHTVLYHAGTTGETVLLFGLLAACGIAIAAALGL
jgi:hypothetical protein